MDESSGGDVTICMIPLRNTSLNLGVAEKNTSPGGDEEADSDG